MTDLRQMIRDILREELGRMRGSVPPEPQVTVEQVQIRSNADLAGFVQRLLTAAQDGRLRADIEAGRHVFRLADTGVSPPIQAHQPLAPTPGVAPAVRFTRGLVGERDVAALGQEVRRLQVGTLVRFTPLARDELRRRGIKIERTAS